MGGSLESSLAISQLNDVQGHLFMVFKTKFCSFLDPISMPIALKCAQNYVSMTAFNSKRNKRM